MSRSLWRLYALCQAAYVYFKVWRLSRRYKSDLCVVALVEHMGDIVACLPIAADMKRRKPGAQVIWLAHKSYVELLAGNPDLLSVIPQVCLGQWIALEKILRRTGISIIDLHVDRKPCAKTKWILRKPSPLRVVDKDNYFNFGGILEAFALGAGVPVPADLQPDLTYCLNSAAPQHEGVIEAPYVVLHARSNEAQKDWTDTKFHTLASHLVGIGVTVIEIGLVPVIALQSPKFLSRCGRGSLRAHAELIAKADLFIGIDSGFAHVANALQTRGVIILGSYRAFPSYSPYSGFYTDPIHCALLRADQSPASAVPVSEVIAAAERFLLPVIEGARHGCRAHTR